MRIAICSAGAMDAELVRACADELAFLAARLNRRAGEMEGMDPDSRDFRNAVRVADFLVREIAGAVRNLQGKAEAAELE
jgi:hypothetical protein